MSRQWTTRAQVSGYRFGVARAEHALVRADVRMVHDPMRSQVRALLTGAVLAALVVAGAGLYGFIRPAPSVGDAALVSADGALYVRVDDTMHPVLNVASARLILGRPDAVKDIGPDALSGFPRGPALGIPGAPSLLVGPADPGASAWAVCDDAGAAGAAVTTVIAGHLDEAPLAADRGMLVTSAGETHLLYQRAGLRGEELPVRARVDDGDARVLAALGLTGVTPRPISAGLLGTFPAVPELAVPAVAGRGAPGPLADSSLTVGTVVNSLGTDGETRFYVVLANGLQQLTPIAAQLMRAADEAGGARLTSIGPGDVASLPLVETLPLQRFPAGPVDLVDAAAFPVLCRSWRLGAGNVPEQRLLAGTSLPLPAQARPVILPGADGTGPGLDAVYLRPGTGEFVTVTGGGREALRRQAGFYVTDAGVRHRVVGPDDAAALGLPEPRPAPWPVLSLLPDGPVLTREAALTARSGGS